MGFFNRLFGGKVNPTDALPAPVEPVPKFPYELLRASGAEAVARALDWRQEWRGSFSPVILGPAKEFELLTEVWDEIEATPQEFIQHAQEVDLPVWFKKRLGECSPLEDLANDTAWKPGPPLETDFATVRDTLSKKVHPWVWVAKVPTAQPCEIPAWLKLGGWNACPTTDQHVAVWRYWQEKHGAKILCVTGDIIEATVSRPPQNKEACYALAREQFAYCDDIVTQGVGSIDALADGLRGSKSWYFWWD